MEPQTIVAIVYVYALAGLIETAREMMLPRLRRLPKLMQPTATTKLLNIFLLWPVGIAVNNHGVYKLIMVVLPMIYAAVFFFVAEFVLGSFIESVQIVWTILFGVFAFMLVSVLGRR